MRKAVKQIAVCVFILIVFCMVCRLTLFNQFTVYEQISPAEETKIRQDEVRVMVDEPEVVKAGEPEIRDGYARVVVEPENPGLTDLQLRDEDGDMSSPHPLRVGRSRTVYDLSTGNFTGDTAVLIAVTLFWLLVSAIMLWHFFRAKGTAFYDYATIYYAGFSLFSLATGLVMLSVTVSHIAHPEQYNMLAAYSAISGASMNYMMLTAPLMLLFAGAMAVSNIALLRHERPRLQNVLGLLVSGLLIAGEAVGWIMFSRDFSGSEWQVRVNNTLQNTYATVFVYFQCMLMGAVICGLLAARHVPAPDKKFIIILGCWFRKDGTLPPLLRGRADIALDFWRRQKAETGKEAFFIPSGGQGKNESMAEAEAIRRYLLSRGVPEERILLENRSLNTYQNMDFSKEIIRHTDPKGKTAFATTSYHVFRSGLWARQAGLAAEGMGSKTKWWFWPNAFMRETVGLLQKRWWQEILMLLILLAFFGILSIVLG